jgi:hypothetical protein
MASNGRRLLNLAVLSILEFSALLTGLGGYVPPVAIVAAVSQTGTGTVVAPNHPPAIANTSFSILFQPVNASLRLKLEILVNEPDSLVDVDSAVVYIYQSGQTKGVFSEQSSYAFKWIRKGSNSPPGNCRAANGCWYELTTGNTWTQSNKHLDILDTSHDMINARTTSGKWVFSLGFSIPADFVSANLSLNFEGIVADRSNATASTNGPLRISR